MAAATPTAPHRRKQRIPPGPGRPRRRRGPAHPPPAPTAGTQAGTDAKEVVVDLARYAAAAQGRNTL